MALKNMIKLKDKVAFGRSGESKKNGTVIKLNPKTAHVKCVNGDVMAVTYNLIQKKTTSKKAAPKRAPSKKTIPKRALRSPKTKKLSLKKNPAPGYAGWLSKQNKTMLKKLDKALGVVTGGRSTPAVEDAKKKHVAVKKELRKRK